jgi:MFS family permease
VSAPARPTPPWYFLLLDLPFGAAVGWLQIAVPFWLERRGMPLEAIAALSGAAFAPHAFKILWIPLLDIGSYKRLWYLGTAALTAALLLAVALVPDPSASLPLYVALLTLLQASASTGHAALNALMATTTRPEDKGKVGGFAMASNVGGTGLLGALGLLLAEHVSPVAGGAALALVVVASAALALRIVEPRHVDEAVARAGSLGRALGLHLLAMLRDLWRTVTSREGFSGLVICLAPVGCQAMSNLFSGIATEYQASAEVVGMVNGVLGGVAGALGSLLGGVLSDRMNRRVAYAASGGLTALCAVAMAAAPLTPFTYAWGTFTYLFAGGIAFATWAGMVLELVGVSAATATKYALFNATANFAISYVTALDGAGAAWAKATFGLSTARGALLTDATLTLAGIAVLVAVLLLTRGRRPGRTAASA